MKRITNVATLAVALDVGAAVATASRATTAAPTIKGKVTGAQAWSFTPPSSRRT